MDDKIIELFCAGEYKLSYALMKGLDEPLDLSKITLEMLTGGKKRDIEIPINKEDGVTVVIRIDPNDHWSVKDLVITTVSFDWYDDEESGTLLTNELWSVLNKTSSSNYGNVIYINNYYHCIGYSKYWEKECPDPIDLTKLLNFIINYE